MTPRQLLDAALAATNVQTLEAALNAFTAAKPNAKFEPVGRRPNNRGAIEVASDAGRSLIERVTNAHDAILELEHENHSGKPVCKSPREAASAWLAVPAKEGLSGLTNSERQALAAKTVVRLEPGEGTQSRLVSVIDQGIGIAPDKLEGTILSLNESNKISKHYLAGTYGQGGSSTFAFSKYVFIVSRRSGSDRVGFTIVKYEDLPAQDFKTGRYVFLVDGDGPIDLPASATDAVHGTMVRHFGFDLTKYTSALGPKSIYGMLGRILFDPVSAIRFENKVLGWNRTIKGARNALNGAVDDGDDESTRGPKLDHNVPLFNVDLGDYGTLGIEYWVLARGEPKKSGTRTKPADNFVDSSRPVVLTHNGQNQGEILGRVIKDAKDGADLPYLQTQGRLICHLNCDRLSPTAKRSLFSSTREQSREGFMLERIRTELINALKADDDLIRLNEEAREQSLKEKDEDAQKAMRQKVAKLLRIAGASLYDVGAPGKDPGGKLPGPDRPPRPKPLPIQTQDPPTFVRIVWGEDREMPFHPGQRRYVRIETDANSDYHNPDDPTKSRLNIAVGGDLKVFGTSPLKGGRMRIGVECQEAVVKGSTGSIRIELYRKGMSALSDERVYEIVEPPPPKEKDRQSSFPEFQVIPVPGPEADEWDYIAGESTDVSAHASNFIMNGGTLYVYYSEAFPRFATELKRFEAKDEASAASFRRRYEMWVAVHALLMYQQLDGAGPSDTDEEAVNELLRQERCRHAVIAAMVSTQEVNSGVSEEDEEAAA